MTPKQILSMILRGCSRQEVAAALTDDQRRMLESAAAENIPVSRQQRRKLERLGLKVEKKKGITNEKEVKE